MHGQITTLTTCRENVYTLFYDSMSGVKNHIYRGQFLP